MARIHKPDYILVAISSAIVIFGLVMLSSASTAVAYQDFGDSYYYLKHQFFLGFLPGIVLLLLAAKTDYHKWKKLSFPLVIVTFLLLIAVFLPGVGLGHGGSSRWLSLAGFSFQPSELAKLTLILYLATLFEKKEGMVGDFAEGFLPFVFILGLAAVFLILQPDIGTLSIIALTLVVVYFAAGASLSHLAVLAAGGIASLFFLIKMAPYRMARLMVFLNPGHDPLGIGYHINQALLAIGSGGFFGLGLGNSRQKFQYLPEVSGDSIFAIIAEELGFIFTTALIILFFVLMYRGFKIAKNSPDMFGRLVAVGITSWFVLQAFVNMGAMLSLMPLTGLPLPFVSYGGSALAISFLALGILVNISKQTQ